MFKKALVLCAAGACLVAASCSSDSTEESSGDPTTTAAGTEGTQAAGTTMPEKGACVNDLRIVNTEADDTLEGGDRELDIVTAWSDQGPHEKNTVNYDSTLELMIAEYEIEEDAQFGYSIPIGAPDEAEDDKYYASFYMTTDEGEIEAGQTFTDESSSSTSGTAMAVEGKINSSSVYFGDYRILPFATMWVTITEIDDEKVCGEITTQTDTDLQTFVGLEGTFVVDRIQALED